MKKIVPILLSLVLTVMFFVGCTAPQAPTKTQASTAATGGFTLLISDEPNDIVDFEELNVTISKIGIQKSNDNDTWTEEVLETPQTIDLVKLQGDNAIDIFHSDNLTVGDYSKVFIYVDKVEGRLIGAESDTTVKLPSGKLQISKPFSISENGEVNFVYDITVNKTGNGKYILKPQIGASGADKTFKNVKNNRKEIGQQSETPKDNKGNNPTGNQNKSFESIIPEEGIFTLLISDEPNDIGDFNNLSVTISKIGVQKVDGDDNWTEEVLDEPQTVDLVKLQGDNTTIIYNDNLSAGDYTKVFIYVDKAEGRLTADPDNVTAVKLPGGKLQISKPFSISEDNEVNFVYDITVIKTGNGQYILKPQIGASGADQPFKNINKVKGNNQNLTFNGTIIDNGSDLWQVKIKGKTSEVDVSDADVEGTPSIGLGIQITGTLDEDGKTIIASKVIVKEAEKEAIN
jgi:hypothetical protein